MEGICYPCGETIEDRTCRRYRSGSWTIGFIHQDTSEGIEEIIKDCCSAQILSRTNVGRLGKEDTIEVCTTRKALTVGQIFDSGSWGQDCSNVGDFGRMGPTWGINGGGANALGGDIALTLGRKKKNVIPFYKPWYVSNGRVNGSPYDPAALGLPTAPGSSRARSKRRSPRSAPCTWTCLVAAGR